MFTVKTTYANSCYCGHTKTVWSGYIINTSGHTSASMMAWNLLNPWTIMWRSTTREKERERYLHEPIKLDLKKFTQALFMHCNVSHITKHVLIQFMCLVFDSCVICSLHGIFYVLITLPPSSTEATQPYLLAWTVNHHLSFTYQPATTYFSNKCGPNWAFQLLIQHFLRWAAPWMSEGECSKAARYTQTDQWWPQRTLDAD